MAGKQYPWRKFYPADWLGETSLRGVSLAARGLWIDCCCHMWTSPLPGVLAMPSGEPMTLAFLSRVVGESPKTVKTLLAELREAGVCVAVSDRDGRDWYGCRRIMRDELRRRLRTKAAQNDPILQRFCEHVAPILLPPDAEADAEAETDPPPTPRAKCNGGRAAESLEREDFDEIDNTPF